MRNKYEIALEVLKELIAENEENKNSEHESVRYSADRKVAQLDQIASELRDKICNYEGPKEDYDIMDFDSYTKLLLFLKAGKISKENIISINYDPTWEKVMLVYIDVEE